MYKLFTDKIENFEARIKLEGASLKKSSARLVVEAENFSIILILPWLPIFCLKDLSPTSVSILLHHPYESNGSTRTPLISFSITSGIAPTFEAITGTPWSIASAIE